MLDFSTRADDMEKGNTTPELNKLFEERQGKEVPLVIFTQDMMPCHRTKRVFGIARM